MVLFVLGVSIALQFGAAILALMLNRITGHLVVWWMIAEDDLPKIFKAFERLDPSTKISTSGTGLGLYLTKKLATEVLGGTVKAESQLGVGSKFFLKFPKTPQVS